MQDARAGQRPARADGRGRSDYGKHRRGGHRRMPQTAADAASSESTVGAVTGVCRRRQRTQRLRKAPSGRSPAYAADGSGRSDYGKHRQAGHRRMPQTAADAAITESTVRPVTDVCRLRGLAEGWPEQTAGAPGVTPRANTGPGVTPGLTLARGLPPG